ncbi:Hypothetical protein ETEE_0033 [Edwardsiella anguillarum ET080813]|uniref:Uncharacterized protein n=1 Tax=Edwardsiella anguillarum ET080813 TaxID=667120 RepID=A0A076LLJ3_9GAMM|nr:Hypothetical protein ETEE_0033 [Edwardsiella anguillarum ET080813]
MSVIEKIHDKNDLIQPQINCAPIALVYTKTTFFCVYKVKIKRRYNRINPRNVTAQ